MKSINYLIFLLITTITMVACDDNNRETLDMSGDVDIHSFTINGVEGVINTDNSTITVIMPNGTDLTSLRPEITTAKGSKVSPESGQSVDFSQSTRSGSEVIYTVSHTDLYQQYKVKVDVARASITKFLIGTSEGKIDDNEKTITVYVPENTDITSLIPIVEYTDGATIYPDNGSVVDFTNPVEYKLTYSGSEFVYTITVILGDEPLPEIVIFNGEDVAPVWANLAATVDSPFPNPQTNGINISPYCASIMKNGEDTDNGGKPWSGGALWNNYKVNIDPALYGSFSLMVLKDVAGDVQIEIQSDGEQNKNYLKAWYDEEQLGKWQKLIFTIPEGHTGIINNILVAPHAHDAGKPVPFPTQRMYWDELISIPR
jgi:hypothetical protein